MARPEFPSAPIGAKSSNGYEQPQPFTQLPLEGLPLDDTETIEFGNCLIASPVTYRKLAAGNRWHCQIVVEPDMFHPDQSGAYMAVAHKEHADAANKCHLRPGDRATMIGTPRQEVIELGNGERQVMDYVYVTDVQVCSRSPRKSITAFEQGK